MSILIEKYFKNSYYIIKIGKLWPHEHNCVSYVSNILLWMKLWVLPLLKILRSRRYDYWQLMGGIWGSSQRGLWIISSWKGGVFYVARSSSIMGSYWIYSNVSNGAKSKTNSLSALRQCLWKNIITMIVETYTLELYNFHAS